MSIIISIWFGFFRRFYGAEKPGFPANRFLGYALPLAFATYFLYPAQYAIWLNIIYLLALCAAFFIGISLVKYSDYWFVASVKDWYMMAYNGLLITLPVGIILSAYSFKTAIVCSLSGILIAPAYWLGWKLPTLNKNYLNKGTEWGEFLGHALIGIVFVVGSL